MQQSVDNRRLSSSSSNTVKIILSIHLIWYINLGIINSFIYIHFFTLSHGDYFTTGLLQGIPYLCLIFTTFLFGWIADHKGEYLILVIAFSTVVISNIFFLTKDSFLFLLLYIGSNFILAAYIPSLNRLASRVVRNKDIFGKLGAVASLGFLIGTFIAGILYDIVGMWILFLLGSSIGGLGLLVLLLFKKYFPKITLPETMLPYDKKSLIKSSLLAIPNLKRFLGLAIIHYFGISIVLGFVSIYLLNELSFSSFDWGSMNLWATLIGMGLSYCFGRYFHNRNRFLLSFSIIGYFIFFCSYIFFTNPTILYLFYLIPAYVGWMIAAPTYLSTIVPERQRGSALGLFGAIQYLGMGLGAIVGGLLGGLAKTFSGNFVYSASFSFITLILCLIFFSDSKTVTDDESLQFS